MALIDFMDQSSEMFIEATGSREVHRIKKIMSNEERGSDIVSGGDGITKVIDHDYKHNPKQGYKDTKEFLMKSEERKKDGTNYEDNKTIQRLASGGDAVSRHNRRHPDRKITIDSAIEFI